MLVTKDKSIKGTTTWRHFLKNLLTLKSCMSLTSRFWDGSATLMGIFFVRKVIAYSHNYSLFCQATVVCTTLDICSLHFLRGEMHNLLVSYYLVSTYVIEKLSPSKKFTQPQVLSEKVSENGHLDMYIYIETTITLCF